MEKNGEKNSERRKKGKDCFFKMFSFNYKKRNIMQKKINLKVTFSMFYMSLTIMGICVGQQIYAQTVEQNSASAPQQASTLAQIKQACDNLPVQDCMQMADVLVQIEDGVPYLAHRDKDIRKDLEPLWLAGVQAVLIKLSGGQPDDWNSLRETAYTNITNKIQAFQEADQSDSKSVKEWMRFLEGLPALLSPLTIVDKGQPTENLNKVRGLLARLPFSDLQSAITILQGHLPTVSLSIAIE